MSKEPYIAYVISNTHWDREWYMSHERYLIRLTELCDRLLEILRTQPDYRFVMDGQYAAIADYLQVRPEKKAEITRYVKAGRLLIGPWYTQPLETLVSGEGLVRNLEYGMKACRDLGGVMEFSYMIDEFGHASQTPQILKGFGIPYAMAWRGIPKGSRNVFRWEAPDGSSVMMFYSNDGYGEATALPRELDDFEETIDGKVFRRPGLRTRVARLLQLRTPNAVSNRLLWLNGIDHSFAQPDLFDRLQDIRDNCPEVLPRQATPTEYAEDVLRDVTVNNLRIATVKGELMYTREDILESTHSNHPRQKLRHYQVEHLLTDYAEPMAVLGELCGGPDIRYALRRAWTYVLENHAHDSLGCTSVDEVYEQVMSRYTCAHDVADQAAEGSVRHLIRCTGPDPALFLFNPASCPQSGVRELTLIVPEGFSENGLLKFSYRGERRSCEFLSVREVNDVRYNPELGHPTHTRSHEVRILLDVPAVPPMGYVRLEISPLPAPRMQRNRRAYGLCTEPCVMENEFLRVVCGPDGTVSVTDRTLNRTFPSQFLFEDDGEAGNSYTHLPPSVYDRSILSSSGRASLSVLYDTPLGSAMEIRMTMDIPRDTDLKTGRRSEDTVPVEIRTTLSVFAGDPVLHARIDVDNKARGHRLRVLFPTGLKNATHSAGLQPFDLVQRPVHETPDPELHEQPYATHPMQGLCSVDDGETGFSVIAPGIYEYECTDDRARALALTLVRSNNVFGSWPFAKSPLYSVEESQNLCKLSFTIHLHYHKGSVRKAFPAVFSWLRPLSARLSRAPENSVMPDASAPETVLPDSDTPICCTNPDFVFTGLYPDDAPGKYRLHILNLGDRDASGDLSFRPFGNSVPVSARRTRLDGTHPGKSYPGTDPVHLKLRRGEVAAFMVSFEVAP